MYIYIYIYIYFKPYVHIIVLLHLLVLIPLWFRFALFNVTDCCLLHSSRWPNGWWNV